MAAQVFIDGEAGTTGLQIRARLAGRREIELISLPEQHRKDLAARRDILNRADLSVLCLPDDAAREAVSLIESPATRIVDASTAHRVAEGWVYGFPELTEGQAGRIAGAKRVANVGCYATASIALIRPLVEKGLMRGDHAVTINAVSGYSGGGKNLIATYEDSTRDDYTEEPFWLYGLTLSHKHLPEIERYGLLNRPPLLVPSVGRFAQGMLISIPLWLEQLPGRPGLGALHEALARHYRDCRFVTLAPPGDSAAPARLGAKACNGSNDLRLYVFGNEDAGQALLIAQLDNLGKGASGSAVQNINLMLGLPEDAGL